MNTIDEYLDPLDPVRSTALQHIRELVHQQAPEATESISYGMPGFKYKGKYLLGFASFKDHLSLFPGGQTFGELEDALKPFRTSKGTLQFSVEHPIPDELIAGIIEARITAI